MNKLSIEQQAIRIRTELGYGPKIPIRWRSLLSELGILTVFKPIEAGLSGAVINVDQNVSIKLMLINTNRSIGHQHSTIAHELYHLLVEPEVGSIVSYDISNRRSARESNADMFASFFVLPTEGLKSLVPSNELKKDAIGIDTILKIEHYYACDRTTLAKRLKDIGLISKQRAEEVQTDPKREAIERGYPTDLYERGNHHLVIGDYGVLARKLYDKEMISKTNYKSLLADLEIDQHVASNLESNHDKTSSIH